MRLDVLRDELRHLRLAPLALGRETHERRELIRKRAGLEERIVRAASLPGGALLGRHLRRVNLTAALAITSVTLEGLASLLGLGDQGARASRDLRLESAEGLRQSG